jgi:putative transposase
MARNAYPTDLTDDQWSRIVQFIPPAKPGGRPRSVVMRPFDFAQGVVVNGILYLNRTGCAWRLLPHEP